MIYGRFHRETIALIIAIPSMRDKVSELTDLTQRNTSCLDRMLCACFV